MKTSSFNSFSTVSTTTSPTTTSATTTTVMKMKSCKNYSPELPECYEFVVNQKIQCVCISRSENLTWNDAVSICHSLNATLLDLHDQNKLDITFPRFGELVKSGNILSGWV